jgi:hypothetical protein
MFAFVAYGVMPDWFDALMPTLSSSHCGDVGEEGLRSVCGLCRSGEWGRVVIASEPKSASLTASRQS